MKSYVEGEWAGYKHIKNVLIMLYTEYKEWQSMGEETDTVISYTIQYNEKYNCISVYM